jgi:hypothetical protein
MAAEQRAKVAAAQKEVTDAAAGKFECVLNRLEASYVVNCEYPRHSFNHSTNVPSDTLCFS